MDCQISSDEEGRLATLYDYNILDTAPDQSFDRITRLARLALQMPIVLISLIDRDRQWFKSSYGVAASELPRSTSFCTHAIKQDQPLVVTDTTIHPLFCNNPFVVGEPFARCYVGIPLKMRNGFNIGTLCAIDDRPRALSGEEIDVLCDLARMVVDEIELRQMATTDSLTGALTRRGFDIEIAREFGRSKRSHHGLSFIALDIDHFKAVNDRYGHAAGDAVLQAVVAMIKHELRSTDVVARLGGEEFVIALPETDLKAATILAERLRQKIDAAAIAASAGDIQITASFGIAHRTTTDHSWAATLAKADSALYEAKRGGRNRCVSRDIAAAYVAA